MPQGIRRGLKLSDGTIIPALHLSGDPALGDLSLIKHRHPRGASERGSSFWVTEV